MASVISAKLDLLIRLVDTTTGAAVDERNVVFTRNGEPFRPDGRGEGTYILINTGREDFLMRIKVFGYEEAVLNVKYESLDERLPEINVFLIPSENTMRGEGVLSFSGILPFLEAIEAVKPNRQLCVVKGFDPKKKLLTYFTQSGAFTEWDEAGYGMLHADKQSYENIAVVRRESQQTVELKEELKEENITNLPVLRIIHGKVDENGAFLLRVRDDGEDQSYLVRYTVNGEVRFQTVNFREPEELV